MLNYLTPNTNAPALLVPGDISAILPSEAVYSAKPQGQHHTRPQGKYYTVIPLRLAWPVS